MRNLRTFPQLVFRIFVLPIFPFLQWLGRVTGIAKEAKTVESPHRRQPFLLGSLKKELSVREAKRLLLAAGFFMNRLAYPDPGQVLSMRRLHNTMPDHQYHLRVFSDGEIRGHFELTPEDHPWKHLDEWLMEPRYEEFGGYIASVLDKDSAVQNLEKTA